MSRTNFFVVFAPNHYGSGGTDINDTCKVLSAHRTYANARKAIEGTTTLVIRRGHLRKGDNFARHSENHYPIATGETEPDPRFAPGPFYTGKPWQISGGGK